MAPRTLRSHQENILRRKDFTGPTTVAKDSTVAPRTGGSAHVRRFIREEFTSEVRRHYRCPAETAIVGESLAGWFVVETFLLEPDLFRRYIAISPSLWWNDDGQLHAAEYAQRHAGRSSRLPRLSARLVFSRQ